MDSAAAPPQTDSQDRYRPSELRLDARAAGIRDKARTAGLVAQAELLRRPELLDRLAADAGPSALAHPVGLRLEAELGPDAQQRLDERALLLGRVTGRGRDAEPLLAARDRRAEAVSAMKRPARRTS